MLLLFNLFRAIIHIKKCQYPLERYMAIIMIIVPTSSLNVFMHQCACFNKHLYHNFIQHNQEVSEIKDMVICGHER